MQNVGNNTGLGTARTRRVYPGSGMVVLHPVAIWLHTTGWAKRVLAVPFGASERPAEPHS
jgi:hypothetical protein